MWEDLKPSQVLTRAAFENAIVVNSAIGGSTNAPIQLNAIARHIGVELDNDDWERIGYDVPLLVNMQPAGEYLGEEYYRAGGVPAVVAELIDMGKIDKTAITINGKSLHENNVGKFTRDREVIKAHDAPMKSHAGFLNLKGNLFDSAIMKTSVISDEFRERYLQNPEDPNAFEGRAMVFDGPEDYHARIDDPALELDEDTVLVIRGVGPIGYPGRGGGRQHARAGLSPEARHQRAAVHRRRTPVRHVGQPVDPQRLAGGCDRRRPGAAADRAIAFASTSRSARPMFSSPMRSSPSGATHSKRPAATRIPRARRRGRRSSAVSSTSCPRAWC